LITYGDMVREPDRPPLASLGDFLEAHVGDVMNTIHILPFYPYSSDDGFSVIDYLEVDPALGEWDHVERMRHSFRLMFDAVLNHISASSEWFAGFRNGDAAYRDFFTVVDPATDLSAVFRPRELPLLTEVETAMGPRHVWTTFSPDQIDLNYANPAVLLAAIEVLLTYVAHGADVIRLDAVTFLWKEPGTACIHLPQTHRIIQLFRSVLNAVAPSVIIITETNVPHEENVSYFGDGSNEADLVYNFALPPLTLHAFQTADATALTEWANGMRAPSDTTTFFNFLASHDGIGVGGARGYLSEDDISAMADRVEELGGKVSYRTTPAGGRAPYELNINYLDALGEPDVDESDGVAARRFLTSQAVMLSLQGMPAIYFHSMFGSRGWPEGVERTGALRTVNRQKLQRGQLETELREAGSLRALVFDGYRTLLRVRGSQAAFAPTAAQQILRLQQGVFAVLRTSAQGSVLCLHNVSRERVAVDASSQIAGSAIDVISGNTFGPTVEMGPHQTLWLRLDAQ
jgi:sucrose phosphorylase